MNNMESVVRYRCTLCGKEFKTPNRHRCRWSPECRNCLSCRHRGRRVTDGDGSDFSWIAFECPFFMDELCEAPCDFDKGAVAKKGNNCPHWELLDGYKGKKSFAKIESERLLAEAEMRSGASVEAANDGLPF